MLSALSPMSWSRICWHTASNHKKSFLTLHTHTQSWLHMWRQRSGLQTSSRLAEESFKDTLFHNSSSSSLLNPIIQLAQSLNHVWILSATFLRCLRQIPTPIRFLGWTKLRWAHRVVPGRSYFHWKRWFMDTMIGIPSLPDLRSTHNFPCIHFHITRSCRSLLTKSTARTRGSNHLLSTCCSKWDCQSEPSPIKLKAIIARVNWDNKWSRSMTSELTVQN